MTKLAMWTVYDHPLDFPDKFVARRFDVDADGPKPTDEVIVSKHLYIVRECMAVRGLVCLTRNEGDDLKIVETWL